MDPHSSVGKESTCNARDPGLIPGLERATGEGISYPLQYSWASVVAQLVKNPPAMGETWIRSLGWEDPLEKGKVTHSSILAWHGLYHPWGLKESDTTEQLSLHFQYSTHISFLLSSTLVLTLLFCRTDVTTMNDLKEALFFLCFLIGTLTGCRCLVCFSFKNI